MSSEDVFVLRPEARFEVLAGFAQAAKWPLAIEETRGHNVEMRRVWKPTPESAVTWREAHSIGVRTVWVSNAPPLAREIAAMLPHFTRDELIAAARGDEVLPALVALRALTVVDNGALSDEVRAAFVRWAEHEDRMVRRAALHVGWIGGWKALAPEIAKRQASDAELGEAWGRLAAALAKLP